MAQRLRYYPGEFCWWELGSPDAPKAKKFYTALFGWKYQEIPLDGAKSLVYSIAQMDGQDCCAIWPQPKEERVAKLPARWYPYLCAENADVVGLKAQACGGEIDYPATDVMKVGRMVGLRDPQGARFGVWEARRHVGAARIAEPGSVAWMELVVPDAARAQEFFSDFLGWSLEESGGYRILNNRNQSRAGLLKTPATLAALRFDPQWLTYFQVEDASKACATAKKAGGKILFPPREVPGFGHTAMIEDPCGTVFCIKDV